MNYPTEVFVDGKHYKVNTDYRNIIGIINAFHDKDLDDSIRSLLSFRLFFTDWKSIANIVLKSPKAFGNAIALFVKGNESKPKSIKPRHYDQLNYKAAMGLIVAAFQRDYSMDITDNKLRLHWRRFSDMFQNLSSENMIIKIMGWYYEDTKGKKGKELREINKAKKEYEYLFHKQNPNDELISISDVSNLVKQKLKQRKANTDGV